MRKVSTPAVQGAYIALESLNPKLPEDLTSV